MIKLLIIGGNGYFGANLFYIKNFDIINISRSKVINKKTVKLDITKQNIYNLLKHLNFDFIINLSTTKVLEKRFNHLQINTTGIKNIIEFSNKKNIPLIHFSSVAIFNKKKTNYDFGKFISEKIIKKRLRSGIILRLPAIITEKYPNFKTLKILKKIKFLLYFLPKRIKYHKMNSPIYYVDVINILKKIFKKKNLKNKVEIYNLYGPDNTSLINFYNKKNNSFKKRNTIEEKLNYNIKSILDYF